MKRLAVVVAVVVVTACLAGQAAAKARSNYPYVQSGPDGAFYARCIPAGPDGTEGTTVIYRVQKGADQVVDAYDWYSKKGVVLGWSPIAGKVAVMSLSGKAASEPDKQVEISFYLGGKSLAVPLPEIRLKDLGQGPDGITTADLTKIALRELRNVTVTAAAGAVNDLSKDLGKVATDAAGEAAGKVTKGLSDILKKKQ